MARQLTSDEHICVSTDDEEIVRVVENYGLAVPFRRPKELSGDQVGTYEVLLHALGYYESLGRHYDVLVFRQITKRQFCQTRIARTAHRCRLSK